MLSWTLCWSQSSDSLWTAPTWKVRELMNIALRAQACDSLVVQQEKTIQSGLRYEASQDSLLRIRSLTNVTLKDENSQWEKRFKNQVSLTKIEKRKKRKLVFISIGLVALGIFTNLP